MRARHGTEDCLGLGSDRISKQLKRKVSHFFGSITVSVKAETGALRVTSVTRRTPEKKARSPGLKANPTVDAPGTGRGKISMSRYLLAPPLQHY